jgi:hypothetical protein
VSFWIRSVYPEGDDTSSVCDYTLGHFKDRMRVTQRHYVTAIGSEHGAVGEPMVSLGTRLVRVWASIVGRVGTPSVLNVNLAQPSGWDATVFSEEATVDEVEAGKVKQHGDDYAAYGRAIISSIATIDMDDAASGWLDAAIAVERHVGPFTFFEYYDAMGQEEDPALHTLRPTMSVGHAIGAQGFDSSAVNVPAAIARWCGNKAMAMQGADSSQFGVATIT